MPRSEDWKRRISGCQKTEFLKKSRFLIANRRCLSQIVLEIDASLSTKKDLALELSSAKRFTHSILRPIDALVLLYQFSERVTELTPFTNDLKRIDNAIQRLGWGHHGALRRDLSRI